MTQNNALNNYSGSTAEQTIVQHANPEAKISERPLTMKYGNKYLTNTTNGYISQWVDRF